MRARGDTPEDIGDRPAVKAAVAGLAALFAAALASGMLDGAPPERTLSHVAAASRSWAGRGGVAGGPGWAPPVEALCFRGPRGEPVDFPAEQNCPGAAAAAHVP